VSDDYTVPADEAMKCLDVISDYDPGDGPKPCVHTFAQSGLGLLGAHWSVTDLRALMEQHGVQQSGEQASAMHHGLVVIRPAPHGPLFIATKPWEPTSEEQQTLEAAAEASS
jgi:hypothetical protein